MAGSAEGGCVRRRTHYHIDAAYSELEVFWSGDDVQVLADGEERIALDPEGARQFADALKLAAQEAQEANA